MLDVITTYAGLIIVGAIYLIILGVANIKRSQSD